MTRVGLRLVIASTLLAFASPAAARGKSLTVAQAPPKSPTGQPTKSGDAAAKPADKGAPNKKDAPKKDAPKKDAPKKDVKAPADNKGAKNKKSDEPSAAAAAAAARTAAGAGDDDDDDTTSRRSWVQDISARVPLVRKGSFRLTMGGLIQTQGVFYIGKDGNLQSNDIADDAGFRLRRARLGFGGQILPDVRFYLAIDLKDAAGVANGGSDPGAELLDATVSWNRYSFMQIALGVDRVPFSAIALRSSGKLMLIERPLMVSLINPNRRIGVRVYGQLGDLGYAVGFYNATESTTSGNFLGGYAAAVRLKYDLFGPVQGFVPTKLRAQLAAAYVFENGPANDSHRAAVTLSLQGFRTRLLGEFLWMRSTPDAEPLGDPDAGVATRWGAMGQLGVFVWGEHVEIAGRYEYYRDNDAVDTAGRQQLISGVLNIYLCKHTFKLQLGITHRDELEGPELANSVVFGQLQAMF